MNVWAVVKWVVLMLAGLLLALVLLLAVFDWNWAKDYIAGKASQAIGRSLTIEGNLDVNLLSWKPQVRAEGIRLANAPWGSSPYMLELAALDFRLDLGALLRRRIVLSALNLERPRVLLEVSPTGEENWRFATSSTPPTAKTTTTTPIPMIEQLWIDDGRLRYRDPTQATDVTATVATTGGPRGNDGIDLKAEGPVQGQNWRLSLIGGSLLQLGANNQSYPLSLRLEPGTADTRPEAAVEIQTDLLRQGDSWQLKDLQGRVGKSDLGGTIAVTLGQARPVVKADLNSRLLDIDQLSGLFVRTGQTPANETEKPIDLSVLNAFNAAINWRADKVIVAGLALDAVALNTVLQEGRLAIAPLSLPLGGGGLQADLQLDANAPPLQGEMQVALKQVDLGQALTQLKLGNETDLGIVDGALKLALADAPAGQNHATMLTGLLERLQVQPGELSYRDPKTQTDLKARIEPAAARNGTTPGIALAVDGKWQDQPTKLTLTGGPVAGLLHPQQPYPLSSRLALGEVQGQVEGQLSQPESGLWQFQDFTAKLGNSELKGRLAADLKGKRPVLTAALNSNRLDLGQLAALSTGNKDKEPARTARRPTAARFELRDGLAPLRTFDANIDLQARQVDLPGHPLRSVSMALRLRDGRLQIDPLRAASDSGVITATVTVDAGATPVKIAVTTRSERIDLKKLLAPYGIQSPQLGVLSGEFNLAATGGDQPLTLDARGRYRNEPFTLHVEGDPLARLAETRKPYGLNATLDIVKSQLNVQGRLPGSFDFSRLDLGVALKGEDPSLFSPLLGFPVPELPPYDLKGRLLRQGSTLKLTHFAGRVGDSDMAGTVQLDLSGKLPSINADLSSRSLDFDDLGGLIGATPGAGPGETVSEAQRQEAAQRKQSPFVLPRKPLHLKRLAGVLEGTINFRGERVKAPNLPLDNLLATVVINNGRVTLKPLEFGIGGGHMSSQISLDTNGAVPQGEARTEIRRVDLRRVLQPFELAENSVGIISGRARFWLTGDSMAQLFASADGGLFMLMTGGRFNELLGQLGELDAGGALAVLVTDPKATIPIHCAYADLHSKDGVMDLSTVVFDTANTLFLIGGSIDFNQERLEVVIEPKPKQFSLLSATSTVHIEGRMKAPTFRPGASAFVRGAAAILAGLATPIAALLPLAEAPTGEDSPYCSGLIDLVEQARRQTNPTTH